MSQFVETPTKTLMVGEAIAQFLRVILTSGKLATAGATDVELGTITRDSFADGDMRAVRLRSAQGTSKMVASGAISQGATAFAAAGGKIASTGTVVVGIVLEASAANNDIIEVLRLAQGALEPGSLRTAEAHTADDTLTAAESGTLHTTVGASGTVTFSMPAATVGQEFFFRVGAAQELRIDPDGTETIALPSTGVQAAAGKYITANAAGESVHVVCDTAGQWTVYGFTGTWTAEA